MCSLVYYWNQLFLQHGQGRIRVCSSLHWFSAKGYNSFSESKVTKHSLQWRQNWRNGVSDHQPHDCLLNRSFRRRSKKTSKLRVTGLCAGNSPVSGEFPAQMASNAENVSIWWRHYDIHLMTSSYIMCICIGANMHFQEWLPFQDVNKTVFTNRLLFSSAKANTMWSEQYVGCFADVIIKCIFFWKYAHIYILTQVWS